MESDQSNCFSETLILKTLWQIITLIHVLKVLFDSFALFEKQFPENLFLCSISDKFT